MRLKSILLSLSAIAALSAGAAHASTNLVTNGNFEQTTNGTNKRLAYTGSTDTTRTTLVGWDNKYNGNATDSGYNFLLDSTIFTTNASALGLHSTTASGVDNGIIAASVGHGSVFASDSQWYPAALSQSISGLTVGGVYTLTFDYALAQQFITDAANTNNYWAVTLGGQTQNTSLLSIEGGGFSGWKTSTMTFTATTGTELLSFLASATASGAPPFMLLDNVSLAAAVPEPSTWAMMLGGVGLMGFVARRRRAGQA